MEIKKHWTLQGDIAVPDHFQRAIGGHPLVAKSLYRRGYRTVEAAQAFLNPSKYSPASSLELPDMDSACTLLANVLSRQGEILVWGDFDVDGQTSTTLLVEALRDLGGKVRYHIPIRAQESHGITREVLTHQLKKGFDLLLTCDTGISEHESIRLVRDASIPVVVTDHHTPGETLPPANAVINPQRLQPDHPLRTLPGVGVAFKLIEGLYESLDRPFEPARFLELSALGIVADVATLQGDTRFLLQQGLKELRKTSRIGLHNIYQQADLNPLHINEEHIGFQIAPRLNAIGRLGDANPIVEFLTTADSGRARVLSTHIEAMNTKRRFATRQVEKAAQAQLEASAEDRQSPAIVLHYPDWPSGIVGIVASHLVEKYHKPVILLSGENPIKGSARSVEGFNITEAIGTQAHILKAYGGHPMAAGLSLPANQYKQFKRGFLNVVEKRMAGVSAEPELIINQNLTIKEIKPALIEEMERLAPFGPGNPAINFLLEDLTIISTTAIGQHGEHRRVIAADSNDNQQQFIWWNGGDESLPDAKIDLVCKLSQSNYKGEAQISAEWIDYRISSKGRIELAQRKYRLKDYRQSLSPESQLINLLTEQPDQTIWGEGDLPAELPCLGRHELQHTGKLIIWTAPPSQAVLREVLRSTKPKSIIVFGLNPHLDDFKLLMERLAGLSKYAVHHREGRVALDELAAACAADPQTVQTALRLWETLGKLTVDFDDELAIIKPVQSTPNQTNNDIIENNVKELLAESQAYRDVFIRGDIQLLIDNAMK